MKEKDMETVGNLISECLHNAKDNAKIEEIKKEVISFCSDFNFYEWLKNVSKNT